MEPTKKEGYVVMFHNNEKDLLCGTRFGHPEKMQKFGLKGCECIVFLLLRLSGRNRTALYIGVAIGFLIFTVFMTGEVGEDYVALKIQKLKLQRKESNVWYSN